MKKLVTNFVIFMFMSKGVSEGGHLLHKRMMNDKRFIKDSDN